jgi:hypothetical protein
MILFGKLALFAWACYMAYVGVRLIMGQGGVALAALEAGRMSEALMLFVFIALLAIGTAALFVIFIWRGVLQE